MLHLRLLRVVCALAAAILFTSFENAYAQLDPWEFEVYPYRTEGRGILEVESLNAVPVDGHQSPEAGTSGGVFPSEHQWYTALEFTYGLTDRIEAAAYVNFARPSGDDFWFAGSKYRVRGRLFDEDTLPVNLGWYVEISQHHTPQFDDVAAELELRPIMEKNFGPVSLRLNPIFEKPLAEGPWEFGYSAGAYYKLSRTISPGVEFYGGLGPISHAEPVREQQHYIFPVINGSLPGGLEYSTGVGFGLTSGSDDVIIKFNLELEKFVGSVFGASPDGGWLW